MHNLNVAFFLDFQNEEQKLEESIRQGRTLNSLPPGDLQIPSIPNLTVANLLFVGKPSVDLKGHEKLSPAVNSSLNYLGLNNTYPHVDSGFQSQLARLGSGSPFSLGQLGTPTHTPPILSSHRQEEEHTLLAVSTGLTDNRMGQQTSSIQMGLGSAANPPPPRSPGFANNGTTPGLSALNREDLNNANSSPIPVPLPPMSSYSSHLSGNFSNFMSSVRIF